MSAPCSASANANRPKGQLADDTHSWTLATTDQLLKADQYRPLIVAYHNGAAVRLSDVAEVVDSVEDMRNAGMVNGKPAVLIIVFRQPGANIIETVDRVLRRAARSCRPRFPPPSSCRRAGSHDHDSRLGAATSRSRC